MIQMTPSRSVAPLPIAPLRVGSVSYLNAKPLIDGLDRDPDLRLSLDVPSRLLDGLKTGALDVALLPVIDYQRLPGLRVIPAGGIGCDGATLTVRIFSRVPVSQIRTLACDTDSHTSVALARIILCEQFHVTPELTSFDTYHATQPDTDAQLLIGDKVVVAEPSRDIFPFQVDLGQAWKELTGLPFVFAVWTARPGVELRDLPLKLRQARQRGLQRIESIVRTHAVPRGWPLELARTYLLEHLKFHIEAPQLQAIRRFHELAAGHGLIDAPPRPLSIVEMPVVLEGV